MNIIKELSSSHHPQQVVVTRIQMKEITREHKRKKKNSKKNGCKN